MAAPSQSSSTGIGAVVETLKAYAKQETVGPLKGAGRWLGAGAAGAILIGLGVLMLAMALLRALQTETGDTFSGNWSFVPYVITLVVLLIAIAIAVAYARRPSIQPKEASR